MKIYTILGDFRQSMVTSCDISFRYASYAFVSWMCSAEGSETVTLSRNLLALIKTNLLDPTGNYMFKAKNRNTKARCEICSKLTVKTPERRQMASFWCLYC